jgi:hypothetical protein
MADVYQLSDVVKRYRKGLDRPTSGTVEFDGWTWPGCRRPG